MRCASSPTITFEHMHELSLRFHLERKTGGLTRVLERGRNGIETIVRIVILQLVADHRRVRADRRRAVLAVRLALCAGRSLVTVALYMCFTFNATEWRIAIRREMNESDTDANTKAIDSLLNYETVKYFGNEEREAERYDRSMARYEQRERQHLDLARRAERRPGGHLHHRPDRRP